MFVKYKTTPNLKIHSKEDVDKFYKLPKTILVNHFTEVSAKEFRAELDVADQQNQSVIPVVIDSYGGSVYALLSMLDAIAACRLPVATIATGKAMSCGSFLLSAGAPGMRYVAPTATVMIHEVSSMAWGKVEDLKSSTKEADRLNAMLFARLDKNCGKTPGWFLDQVHALRGADWYLDAGEVVKSGLANHVGVPTLSLHLSATETFGLLP